MKRMTGLDAAFLYGETASVHMHTLKIAIVDGVDEGVEATYRRLRKEVERRLHLLPPFRLRVVDVPLKLHHPLWVDDPDFDIDNHLRRIRIPAPGGRREMDRTIASIANAPLDRSRPLWEVWMLHGLAEGRVAFVGKLHHAIADGNASAGMIANVMGIDPLDTHVEEQDEWRGEQIPSRTRLVFDALREKPARVRKLPALLARAALGATKVIGRTKRGENAGQAKPFDAPYTAFNRSISANRSFATTNVAFADIKSVKDKLGVTVNDVVLGVVAGALRSYLSKNGGTPERPLVASVPVSVKQDPTKNRRLQGNELSNMFASLCTHVEDPSARVLAIHEGMKLAKVTHEDIGDNALLDLSEYLPRRLYTAVVRAYSKLGVADLHRPPANVIVSNVRGPAQSLFVAGARLHDLYSVGPVLEGLGLNLTAWSYEDRISFAVIADAKAIPDAHLLIDELHGALAELLRAVQETATAIETAGGDAVDSGANGAAGGPDVMSEQREAEPEPARARTSGIAGIADSRC